VPNEGLRAMCLHGTLSEEPRRRGSTTHGEISRGWAPVGAHAGVHISPWESAAAWDESAARMNRRYLIETRSRRDQTGTVGGNEALLRGFAYAKDVKGSIVALGTGARPVTHPQQTCRRGGRICYVSDGTRAKCG